MFKPTIGLFYTYFNDLAEEIYSEIFCCYFFDRRNIQILEQITTQFYHPNEIKSQRRQDSLL